MIFIAGHGAAGGAPGGLTVLDPASAGDRYQLPVSELSYLALHPGGRYLYGVSGLQQGQLHAWRLEDGGRSVVALGAPVDSGGVEPCHLVVDPTGRHLLVANYGGNQQGSVALFTIAGDGSPRPAGVVGRRTSPGPDARQAGSHIHQVVPAGDDRVLVVDLGADEVVDYRLSDGRLSDPVVSAAPAGSGPRHLVQLTGGTVLVSAELDSTLLRARQVGRRLVDWRASPASGLVPPVDSRNYPSDLVAAADRRSVYLANRGTDSIALLSVDSGLIRAEMPCGAWPRQLALNGDLLYVASTNADEVGVFDAARLVPAGPPIAVARPMCVVVLPEPG